MTRTERAKESGVYVRKGGVRSHFNSGQMRRREEGEREGRSKFSTLFAATNSNMLAALAWPIFSFTF